MLGNFWFKKEKPLLGLTGLGGGVGSNLLAGSGSGFELPAYLTNTDDLVYYIDMHNSESYSGTGTAITDLSGAGENYATTIEGTLNTDWFYLSNDPESSNPAWGREDDQDDGYIRTTNTGSSNLKFGTSSFTIEMWVRPYSWTGYFVVFQSNWDANNNGNRQSDNSKPYIYLGMMGEDALPAYEGKVRAYIRHYPNGSAESLTMYSSHQWSGYNSSSGQWGNWNHIVLTRSSSTFKLYVNSNLRETDTSTGTMDFDGDDYCANFMDDGRSTGQGDFGRFGAARIYKGTALSSSDILAHWDGEKAAYGH